VKNAVKGEDDIQDRAKNTYGFIDEFLEDAIKSSDLCEELDTDYDPWNPEQNTYTSIRMNSTLHNTCMSLTFLPEKYYTSILDGGADTCALRKVWEILSVHNSRSVNVVKLLSRRILRLLVTLLL
jgi:hypothetical protein